MQATSTAAAEGFPRVVASGPDRVAAAAAGDRSAFTRLYRDNYRLVRGIVLARAPRADVADVVQDVFLVAWRDLPKLRDGASFPAWLAGIARRRAATIFRRRRPEPVEARPETPEVALALDLLRTIQSLGPAAAELLTLRLVEGMTSVEIGARLGRSPESIRVSLHRAVARLRKEMADG